MRIVIKYAMRHSFITNRIATLLIIAISLTLVGVGRGYSLAVDNVSGITIVVDAGHGGIDSGTIGVVTKNKESDLNLAISNYLGTYLANAGMKVVYTRTTQDGLYGEFSNGFKKRDMESRRQTIISARADLVVSVHLNKFADSSRRGAQVYYQVGGDAGKQYADCIQQVLNKYVNTPTAGREYTSIAGDFYMCRCVSVPSCIVECGFLSNPDDDRLLATSEYQRQIAEYIYMGILSYLGLK